MYMSQISLRRRAAEDSAYWRLAAGHGQQDHKLIWRIFSDSPRRRRDFLFRRLEAGGGLADFLAVSERPPRDDGLWRILSKEYRPKLKAGQRLAFSLRANPVVSRRDHGGRQARHDVVMDRKKLLKNGGAPPERWPSQAELVQEAGEKWLAERAERHGFRLEPGQVRAEGYHQVRFRKGRSLVSLSSLDLTGLLTVSDPRAFQEALFTGVGPAKGYGFGLLLVRPA